MLCFRFRETSPVKKLEGGFKKTETPPGEPPPPSPPRFDSYIYTVGSRSLWDHTFQKLIKISILVREVVWGLFFEFESSSGRPCQELNCEFERPPLLAAAAAAAAVQADGQTAHWLHGENHC